MADLTEAQLIRPVLEVLSDAHEWNKEEIDRSVEQRLGLSAGELRRDGNNQVDWAKSTLTRTGCVQDPRNPDATKNRSGVYQILHRGRDALDVLRKEPPEFEPPNRQAFGRWLDTQEAGIRPADEPIRDELAERGPSASTGEPSELDELARDLYIDAGWLRDVVKLLEGKRQLIFYGPPGTGKTYIARKLARFLADGDPQRLEIVQFHPSYSYEDFVQGYRPRSGPGGTLSYKLADGPLVRLAHGARKVLESTNVLLIDEINRGNLPRIFGELLYLLEYRDEEVSLMYGEEGEEHFSLPENLWVLGTMNTADRSIGLIDAALRRRFHFVPLFPGEPPVDALLARWLSKEAPSMRHVAAYVDRLNVRLRERFGRHLQVGHSYFMVKNLDEAHLERIWKADVIPLLEDHLFGHDDELETFSLGAIRRGTDGVARAAPDEPGDADN